MDIYKKRDTGLWRKIVTILNSYGKSKLRIFGTWQRRRIYLQYIVKSSGRYRES